MELKHIYKQCILLPSGYNVVRKENDLEPLSMKEC